MSFDKDKIIAKLMVTFVAELDGYLLAFNDALLQLEQAMQQGSDFAEIVKSLLRTAHSLKGAARSVNMKSIENSCHRMEEVFSQILNGGPLLTAEDFAQLFQRVDKIAEEGRLIKSSLKTPTLAAASNTKDTETVEVSVPSHIQTGLAYVRVATERFDDLLSQSGEMLGAVNRIVAWRESLAQIQGNLENDLNSSGAVMQRQAVIKQITALDQTMRSNYHHLKGIARSIDNSVHKIRLLPFAEACEGLKRMVRDLAQQRAKEAELHFEGSDVEIDRSVLEALKDPLRHLLRNAVDHGIEIPTKRREVGKNAVGRIVIKAELRGGIVLIKISDDGAGFDFAAIKHQLNRRGLAIPEDENELARSVFRAGFSTQEIITDVSGRGVGLDVVRGAVELCHGSIAVSSIPGKGTTFTLTLPVTLTTMQGFLLYVADRRFIIATASVERAFRLAIDQIISIEGRPFIMDKDEPVPVAALSSCLGIETKPEKAKAVKLWQGVIVSIDGRRLALVVDELGSCQDWVVKNLGVRVRATPQVLGTSILANGHLAFILNPSFLVHCSEQNSEFGKLEGWGNTESRQKRILIAEDSVTTRSLEKHILQAAGYDVVTASDGEKAWEILAVRNDIDLLVSDVEMPELDGFELTERVRSVERLARLPIILVTGREDNKDKLRGIDVGAHAYLVKSAFDQTNLLETIALLL